MGWRSRVDVLFLCLKCVEVSIGDAKELRTVCKDTQSVRRKTVERKIRWHQKEWSGARTNIRVWFTLHSSLASAHTNAPHFKFSNSTFLRIFRGSTLWCDRGQVGHINRSRIQHDTRVCTHESHQRILASRFFSM